MAQQVEHRFPADHPAAAGHFPGQPVIPAALLLDEVRRAVAEIGGLTPRGFLAVKFLHPVRPGDELLIRWEDVRGAVRFECRLSDPERLAVSGLLTWADEPPR